MRDIIIVSENDRNLQFFNESIKEIKSKHLTYEADYGTIDNAVVIIDVKLGMREDQIRELINKCSKDSKKILVMSFWQRELFKKFPDCKVVGMPTSRAGFRRKVLEALNENN